MNDELEKIAKEMANDVLTTLQHDCSAPISPNFIASQLLKHLQKIKDYYEKKIKELKKSNRDCLEMYLSVK